MRALLFVTAGFLVTLGSVISYFKWLMWFPATRDFPGLNLALFVPAGALVYFGLRRAFHGPGGLVVRTAGSLLGALSVALVGVFLYFNFYFSSQLPSGEQAPRLGQQAPDFTLTDQEGRPVSLSSVLGPAATASPNQTRRALLVFYRGYW